MKKIGKKQKIIGLTAIVLILVILAIVITKNITRNTKISNEGYFGTTANANSNLVASCIQKGITIGGITGTLEVLDTSDATATAEDIALGKTAYVNGQKVTGTRIDTVAQAKESQLEFSENKTLVDDYGNIVKVPEGFKISQDSSTSVTGGVVIEDVKATGATEYTKGSQFVWIPVGNVITDKNGSKTTITLGRYSFDSDGTPSPYSGSYTEDTSTTHNSSYGNVIAKDIEDFKTKATKSHGYYIGRYEAGDATAVTSKHSSSGTTKPVTCKSRVYPYNYVTQSQAASLAQGMYSSSNFESDLINSYAWDTAIVFIQTFSEDENYSMQKGKNTTLTLQKCGESILNSSYVDDGDEAQDVRCNIYDMAANTFEWTTETYSSITSPCVRRGGYYATIHDYTSGRYDRDTTYSNDYYSFRPTLYL